MAIGVNTHKTGADKSAKPAHASFAPSAAESWMHCYGYVNATRGLPREDTDYTLEGMLAHEANEDCLRFGFDASNLIGSVYELDGFTFEVDEEISEQMQPGIDEIREFGGELFIEHRVDLSRWMPEQFGRLDTAVLRKDLMIIRDFKWGMGVPVSPIKNKQMMTYAAGFWDNIARHRANIKRVLLLIDQPRHSAGGGQWECGIDDILDHMEDARKAFKLGSKPDAPRRAGEKACFWCPKKLAKNGGCAEYEDFMESTIAEAMQDYEESGKIFKPVNEISMKRRLRLYKHSSMITKYLDLVHADLLDRAMNYGDVPKMKAVAGRKGRKKWVDPEKAKKFLSRRLDEEDLYKVELVSPSVAEKKLPRQERVLLKKLYVQGEGKPVLVREEDRRPALSPLLDAFNDYEE